MDNTRSSIRAGFALVCMVGFIFLTATIPFQDGSLYAENGPLENLQVLLLFLSAIAFLIPVSKAPISLKYVLLAGALLSCSFILRELDVENLNVPKWVVSIGSGVGRNIVLGSGWIALGVLAIKSISAFKENFRDILLSRTMLLLVIAGVILLFGALFDHKDNKTSLDELAEEVIEVLGYATFFLAALASRFTAHSLLAKEDEVQKRLERIDSSEQVRKDVAENQLDVPAARPFL
ncbi:MAG: hypothetical protein V3V05_08885 [Pontiella sp.]